MRWILCEAAQTAKRSPEFAASYQAIAHRRGKKIATTAIARKLLTRAYHLLVDAPIAVRSTGTAGARGDIHPGSRPEGSSPPGELVKPHEPALPRSMT